MGGDLVPLIHWLLDCCEAPFSDQIHDRGTQKLEGLLCGHDVKTYPNANARRDTQRKNR